MCGLMWVFCEWANKIKARKFVPQLSSKWQSTFMTLNYYEYFMKGLHV